MGTSQLSSIQSIDPLKLTNMPKFSPFLSVGLLHIGLRLDTTLQLKRTTEIISCPVQQNNKIMEYNFKSRTFKIELCLSLFLFPPICLMLSNLMQPVYISFWELSYRYPCSVGVNQCTYLFITSLFPFHGVQGSAHGSSQPFYNHNSPARFCCGVSWGGGLLRKV